MPAQPNTEQGKQKGADMKKAYDDYDKNAIDTLIVMRDGRQLIERYKNQNLDEYDHEYELNHDRLLELKYSKAIENISIQDIFEYLKKYFNLK